MFQPVYQCVGTVALLAGSVFAADVIHVGPGGSVEEAISKASPGDVVLVAPGTYEESFDLDADSGVTVRSSAGPEKTFLVQGPGRPSIIRIYGGGPGMTAAPSSVEGMTLIGATTETPVVVIDSNLGGSDIRLVDCSIFPMQQGYTPAILIRGAATPTIAGCTISGFTTDEDVPGAVMIEDRAAPTFIDTVFSNNHSSYEGGAVYVQSSDTAKPILFRRCVFTDNTAGNRGGAIATTEHGGGALLRVEDCTFERNTTGDEGGGAIATESFSLQVVRSVFRQNAAPGGQGGAIRILNWQDDNAPVPNDLIESCRFESNTAEQGYAVFASDAALVVSNSVFWKNIPEREYSAALDIEQSRGPVKVVNNTIVGNVLTVGVARLQNLGLDIDSPTDYPNVVSNNIIWDNGRRIPDFRDEMIVARYNNVEFYPTEGPRPDGWGLANFGADPMFVDQAVGDFRLLGGSPSIDQGLNSDIATDDADIDGNHLRFERVQLDIEGSPRRVDDPASPDAPFGNNGVAVDQGAFEFAPTEPIDEGCPADLTGDDVLNIDDVLEFLSLFQIGCG